jgi:hypothetical protein
MVIVDREEKFYVNLVRKPLYNPEHLNPQASFSPGTCVKRQARAATIGADCCGSRHGFTKVTKFSNGLTSFIYPQRDEGAI